MKKVMFTIALTMTASIVMSAKPKTAPKPQLHQTTPHSTKADSQ